MLHEFVTLYRDEIIDRARQKVTNRPWPLASTSELQFGVPLFLTQLVDTLRLEASDTAVSETAISDAATQHGRELLEMGFNVSQVVHDYGDICQAITELALEQHAPITTEEFHILNRSLDSAIAGAVTEHARITQHSRDTDEIERTGHLSHELRDLVHTALLAYATLKQGTVAINGSTGSILGRTLLGLRDLVESSLSELRIAGSEQRRERLSVISFLNEIATAAGMHAESNGVTFKMESLDTRLTIDADPQVLASAVMNLLNNAFKFTPAGGSVVLRAQEVNGGLVIEVEDQCGGIADSEGDPFRGSGVRRDGNHVGMGLGLAIARKAVRAHGGEITTRNLPGHGCIFLIELPLAAPEPAVTTPN
jgi:signal transduction histidine kinase